MIDTAWLSAIGAAVVGTPTLAFALTWLRRVLSKESKLKAGEDGTKETIEGLRAENERLREHNAKLVEGFLSAQTTIIRIAGENQRLQGEIDELKRVMDSLLAAHACKE